MIELLARALRQARRAVTPLVDPDAAARRGAEADVARRLDQTTRAVVHLADQIERVVQRVDKIDRAQRSELQQAVQLTRWTTRRQSQFLDRLLRDRHQQSGHEFVRERVLRRLLRISRGTGPILVGPWTGEVGFELLYWAPFVRWAVRKFDIDPARLTVVSRGGTAAWYGEAAARYLDIFELVTPDEFRTRTLATKMKQRWMRLFDRQLVRRAAERLGSPDAAILHPALAYALFMPYWNLDTSHRWVEQFAEFERIAPPPVPGLERLPADYVAARFYFSECFRDTPENRATAAAVIQALAERTDVVVLSTGILVDDHHDLTTGAAARVHTVAHLMEPHTNLAVQTAVIARARAFVGTYGGFSYLAPLCGVSSLALYARRNYHATHLDLAGAVLERIGGGTLSVVDAAALQRLGPRLVAEAAAPTPAIR